jgi:hypothetical protein
MLPSHSTALVRQWEGANTYLTNLQRIATVECAAPRTSEWLTCFTENSRPRSLGTEQADHAMIKPRRPADALKCRSG